MKRYAELVCNGLEARIKSLAITTLKTRLAVGDASALAFKWLWSFDANKFVERGINNKVVFITTELTVDQIQVMFISYISGVDEDRVKGKIQTTEEEDSRILQAIEIIKEAEETFKIIYMPEPTSTACKATFTDLAVNEGYQYFFFDYMHENPSLAREYHNIPSWQAMEYFSIELKTVALELNIYIQTSTQLNALGNEISDERRGVNSIKGSKAIINKVDFFGIMTRLTPDLEKTMRNYAEALGVPCPTHVLDIPKSRFSDGKNFRIFSCLNLGTCRTVDVFATDLENNIVPIKSSILIQLPNGKTRRAVESFGGISQLGYNN